jgi:hypothetical protein
MIQQLLFLRVIDGRISLVQSEACVFQLLEQALHGCADGFSQLSYRDFRHVWCYLQSPREAIYLARRLMLVNVLRVAARLLFREPRGTRGHD